MLQEIDMVYNQELIYNKCHNFNHTTTKKNVVETMK